MRTANLWGKKIGMTQLFVGDKVVPVTAIDVANWVITNVKTNERDGYDAVQIGLPRKRYIGQAFSADWLKKSKQYFSFLKEIRLKQPADIAVGQSAELLSLLTEGDVLHVTGTTKGCGFAGVVRRHDFNGPPGSHGSTMGKRPGAMSFMRSRGRVIKGKRLPGHMGVDQVVMQNLEVVKIEKEAKLILVKGSVPGKSGSLVSIRKA
jgi:large subunit ribosomal protein L3